MGLKCQPYCPYCQRNVGVLKGEASVGFWKGFLLFLLTLTIILSPIAFIKCRRNYYYWCPICKACLYDYEGNPVYGDKT